MENCSDISHMSDILSRLEGNYLSQAAEVAHITERTEETRLHYAQVSRRLDTKDIFLERGYFSAACSPTVLYFQYTSGARTAGGKPKQQPR